MIEVHLYGKLCHYAPWSGESVLWMQLRPGDTVATILGQAGIPPENVYHVSLNGAILSTRNSMAPWLQYKRAKHSSIERPTAGVSRMAEGLAARAHDGDPLGLFADSMALLVV